MSATLFNCQDLEAVTEAEPKIVTPLGVLAFDAEFDGIVIGDLKPSFSYCLASSAYLLNWTLDDVTAELLLCRPSITLPEGMATTDCWAGLWRLYAAPAAISGVRPEFSCRWVPGYQWTEGGPSSGEWLDAQTWENAETIVTVGTADCESLAGQAKLGLLPPRWTDLLGGSYGGITPDIRNGRIDPTMYLEDGFRLVLPDLSAGETCQVQFVAAWAPNTDEAGADACTWYAVDQNPKQVLLGAGCC